MKVAEQYIKRVGQELKGNLFNTDMSINKVQWTYCYFLSKKRPIVYMLCISTAIFDLERQLRNKANANLYDITFFDFEKQATDLLAETTLEMQDVFVKEKIDVFQKCVKIHNGGNYHEILKGVINVPHLTKNIITNFINEFLDNGETYWYSSSPVVFTETQLQTIF